MFGGWHENIARFGRKNRGGESCRYSQLKDKLNDCTLQAAKKATLFVGLGKSSWLFHSLFILCTKCS